MDVNNLEGTALNRAIASALGWHVELRQDGCVVRSADGDKRLLLFVGKDYAWEYIDKQIPDWANDAQAALELVATLQRVCMIFEWFGIYYVEDIIFFLQSSIKEAEDIQTKVFGDEKES
jgi:hypothetical protein